MAQDKISQPAPGKPGAELETTPQIQITDVDTKNEKKDDAVTRRITIMRIIQSGLSSLLSLAIAVWQGKVYVTYQNTKSLQRAWPDTPNLVPTLLLFSVAIAAFVFDVCMLVAYVMPYGNKHARRAIAVGGAANYIVTSAKTVAYAISAVISRTSYNFGNATSQNSDLWSWTCTDQAATMDNMTQAETNCTLQVRALSHRDVSTASVADVLVAFDRRCRGILPLRRSSLKDLAGSSASWSGGKGARSKMKRFMRSFTRIVPALTGRLPT